ncbi:ABC transporter ATP-binding protein [Brevibacillus reuszeri]|uniref:ABC transporter ATP-binding protein n=1 Tax=Brevibacillus reuszeri TaxID=54915 RepID=UPI002898982E|nr:ABC transporter ATP-binding protein [Brevibacillus reuszeri]
MKEAQEHTWKLFFQLIIKSKLPWILLILYTVVQFGLTKISLMSPQVYQKIMAGEIFDTALISQYIWLSIASALVFASGMLIKCFMDPMITRNIQQMIWPKLIRMPMRLYDKINPLNLISRVTIDPTFFSTFITYIPYVLTAIYTLVGSFVIMYGMNEKLAFAILLVIPYMLIVSVLSGHFTQKTQYVVQERLSILTGFFAERLPKIRLIKTVGKEEYEIEKGHDVFHKQYIADKKRALVEVIANSLVTSVEAVCTGIVLIYGGILAAKGEMQVSEVIAFYMFMGNITIAIGQFGYFWQYVKEAKGATAKIASFTELKDEDLKRNQSFESVYQQSGGDVTFENVSFSYEDKKVLFNLNLTIPEGLVTAIVGPSGGGKTTLFSLLEQLYEPNTGRIIIGDVPANKVHLDEWRQSIAYVSQNSPLLSGTIRDNITYGIDRPVTDEEVREAARLAAALEFIDAFPKGLDTEVGEYGSKLSGGQRQRIAIARAFIKNPKYLLLDEATSNLDARSEHLINNALKSLMKGRTTVMICHDLKEMANVDNVIVIDNGRISGTGSHKELMKNNELYRKLVDIQKEKIMKMNMGYNVV